MTDTPSIDSGPFEEVLAAIRFTADGLVPAIAQAEGSGEILMMAWMNRDAVVETLSTGRVCYWSRSRGGLWRKGETSGQVQRLKDFRVDCDGDTLLLIVEQDGVACHTGRRSRRSKPIRPFSIAGIRTATAEREAMETRFDAAARFLDPHQSGTPAEGYIQLLVSNPPCI